MKEMSSDEARRNFRLVLNEVEHDGQHVAIHRYGDHPAVIVPRPWYDAAAEASALIDQALEDMDAGLEWQSVMAALREARRSAGLAPQDPRVVDHLDGNPRNNDPANLRIMDQKENGR